MSGLYVPPEGAMQFEIGGGKPSGTKRVHVYPAATLETVIWVMPELPNNTGCDCSVVFPIVIESLSPLNQAVARREAARTGGYFVICRCRGRIIE